MNKIILLLSGLLISTLSYSQTDSLIFKNGNYVVGEVKSMDRGILKIETDYSDSDFEIEWDGIKEFYSDVFFLLNTTDGMRYYGTIKSISDNQLQIDTDEGETITKTFDEIVFLKSVDKGFLDRLYAGIDIGYSITRARNQRQFTMRTRAGYLAERWAIDASYNSLKSKQDDTEDINRTDAFISYRYIFRYDWFLIFRTDFLSNTEQKLDLRTNIKVGAGKYFFRTNSFYWAFMAGTSFTNENFSLEGSDRKSAEGWFGTELNLFNIGDFSMNTNVTAYPSFTESGRWRVDYGLDLNYDLPLDFYIKTGLTLNFDNQPVEGATRSDYVWQTGIGWEW